MKVKFIALFFMVCFTSCFSENKDIFSIKDTKKNIEFSLNDSRAKIEELYHITETNQDFVSTKGLEIYFINNRILSIDIQSSCYKLSGNISVGSSIKKLYKIYNRQPDLLFVSKGGRNSCAPVIFFSLSSSIRIGCLTS